MEMAKKICLNMSDHPTEFKKRDGYTILSIAMQIPPEIISDELKLAEFIHAKIIGYLKSNPEVIKSGQTGKLALIPPGLASSALICIATLHGIFGYFPKIFWSYRTPDGFDYLPRPCDLQKIRDKTRIDRPYLID